MLADPVGHETEKADFRESFGEDVEEETAHEGFRLEGHGFSDVAVPSITVGERDGAGGEGNYAIVGNGDAVGVTAEIIDDALRAVKGRFGVNDPIG